MPQTLKNLLKGIYGALVLDDILPHKWRRFTLHLSFGAATILLAFMVLGADFVSPKIRGGFLLTTAIALFFASLEAYFYSAFANSNIGKWILPYEIGKIIFYADDEDLTRGLLYSNTGDEAMKRLGFSEEEIKSFLQMREKSVSSKALTIVSRHTSASEYAKILCESDLGFTNLLSSKGLSDKDFAGALDWVIARETRNVEKERWWSREALGRVPGLGKNWSYGETYILERYGEDMMESRNPASRSYQKTAEVAVSRLESVLGRGRGANAVIVSEDESARKDVLSMLAGKIAGGTAYPSLEHKRIFLLNPNLLIEASHDKISFERNFTDLIAQAVKAGNVILAIPYFSSFVRSAANIGSDVVSILAPYVNSPAVHIVALDSEAEYHGFLSGKDTMQSGFEMIKADEGSESGLIGMLEAEAEEVEKASHALITYPAITAIAESAKRYFDLSAVAEKARDTLVESVASAVAQGRKIVEKSDVLSIVEAKTGIPAGAPKAAEKKTLLNLESSLHERVVGQDEAVRAVSDALKRSRAGVKNPDKPIGTFLFLGPTGVGKTETAKALASIYFGSEEKMSRLDMSEFRDAFAMERLIGSFGTGKAGALSMTLREKPYSVLLLDEFEKTTQDVMNLFLRVFDEGVFTDADGRKVNARENIIIATSNAGSDLIWEIIKSGGNLAAKKDEVVDAIIKQGIFKPELLNRFDAVVLFHPLLGEDLEKVAKLIIGKLSRRMNERGIALEATPGAVRFIVSRGADPKFGARAMQRALQEEVEKMLAEKIIAGEIQEGSHVSFEADSAGALQMKKV